MANCCDPCGFERVTDQSKELAHSWWRSAGRRPAETMAWRSRWMSRAKCEGVADEAVEMGRRFWATNLWAND